MKLVLHSRSQKQLAALGGRLPQSLLVTGPAGIGKQFTVKQWLEEVSEGSIVWVSPDEKAGISVAQVRDLYRATRSKQTVPQLFVLDQADQMSIPAQNAFLKLLEEPNENIFFVLLASNRDALLPTIHSRAQEIALLPVSNEQLGVYLQQFAIPPASLQQILFIAGGRVGLASRLAQDDGLLESYREQAAAAKTLLSGSAFERLKLVGSLATDRAKTLELLEIASGMGSALLARSTSTATQRQLVAKLETLNQTMERLSQNGNTKIQLTHLALSL